MVRFAWFTWVPGAECGRWRGWGWRSCRRGTVTFLLTDIEGSTRLWEQMRELRAHSETVDRDHACAYARTHIDVCLAPRERALWLAELSSELP